MAKIARINQKQFGADGPNGDFGQFGSLKAGAPTYTKDPTTIQALANFLQGLGAETVTGERPALEDINSLFLLIFRQICYMFQAGIPEYDASTTYYIGSVVQVSGIVYQSIVDDNTGNAPASSPTKWKSGLGGLVDLYNAQTVGGIKTFSSFPVTPSSDPNTDYQVANKKYVDGKATQVTVGTGPTNGLVGVGGYNVGPYTSGQYYYLVFGKASDGTIKVISGVGSAGSQIPLPAGCAQANCSWIISPKYFYTWAGIAFDTYISPTRVVTIYTYGFNWV